MGKNILVFIIIVFITSSCYHDKIEGNGKVTIEDRAVDKFEKVFADGVFNVFVNQGDECKVEVETDRNLQDIISVQTRNNRLYLEIEENINFDATKMNIFIFSPSYNLIECNGVVNISSETTIETDDFEITNNGVGNISLSIVCENLDIFLNGVGNINLDGSASNLKAIHNGVGKLDTYDLPANIVNVINSGVGNSEIYVLDELSVVINGVGSVYYRGNPKSISSSITGVGNLKKR